MPNWVFKGEYATPGELYTDTRITLGNQRILEETILTFDKVRSLHGGPIRINSGRRTEEGQEELRKRGYRTATYSPHVWGAALDIDVPDKKTDEYIVALIFGVAEMLGFQPPRVGWRKYRDGNGSSTFVHFDYAFLLDVDSIPHQAKIHWLNPGLTW